MEFALSYKLVRSHRKTICLSLTATGEPLVKAPLYMSIESINDFVEKHHGWIEKHREKQLKKAAKQSTFTWDDGNLIPILGIGYTMSTDPVGTGIHIDGDKLLLPANITERSTAVTTYLKQMAYTHLKQRVDHFCQVMNVYPSGILITSARSRWGSCTGKNRLCFSFRLICAHPDAIDAVVVHELAHLRIRNHSAVFYREIASYLPDYSRRNDLLREIADSILF